MNFNYLVIGSNSFAASNFTKTLLASGKKVITVSRSKEVDRFFLLYEKNKNYKFYKVDINKNYKKIIFLIKKYNIKYIINFSAQGMVNESWLNPLDWYRRRVAHRCGIRRSGLPGVLARVFCVPGRRRRRRR